MIEANNYCRTLKGSQTKFYYSENLKERVLMTNDHFANKYRLNHLMSGYTIYLRVVMGICTGDYRTRMLSNVLHISPCSLF